MMNTWMCHGINYRYILTPTDLVGHGRTLKRCHTTSTMTTRSVGVNALTQRHESYWIRGFSFLNTPTVQDADLSGVNLSEGSGRNALLLLWHKVRAGNRSESASQSTHEVAAEKLDAWDNQQGGVQRVGGSSPATGSLKLKTHWHDNQPLRAIILETFLVSLRGLLCLNLRLLARQKT